MNLFLHESATWQVTTSASPGPQKEADVAEVAEVRFREGVELVAAVIVGVTEVRPRRCCRHHCHGNKEVVLVETAAGINYWEG